MHKNTKTLISIKITTWSKNYLPKKIMEGYRIYWFFAAHWPETEALSAIREEYEEYNLHMNNDFF